MEDEEFQSSQLDESQLKELEKNAEQGGTANATKWAMNKWNDWLEKRSINIDVSSIQPETLAGHLYRFYAELKCKDKRPLSPSGLVGVRAGMQRGLIALRKDPIDIVKDPVFAKANNMFTAKCKLYNKSGNAKPKRKQDIAPGDLAKLREYLGDPQTFDNPKRLSQAVWFILAFNLGCRGRELYRQLKKESITYHEDDVGQAYATVEQTVVEKNHAGGPDDRYIHETRIYDFALGSHQALELIKRYVSKLHTECIWLFQQVRPNAKPGDTVWYKNEPLGVNSIAGMMSNISDAAKLSARYTNHCVRATTINVLLRDGVDGHNIIARTGHKSVESIQPYIGHTTADQKRNESGVLMSALGVSNLSSSESTSITPQSTSTAPQATSTAPQSTSTAPQSISTAPQSTSTAIEFTTAVRSAVPMMPSGTFHNCTFNFNVNQ